MAALIYFIRLGRLFIFLPYRYFLFLSYSSQIQREKKKTNSMKAGRRPRKSTPRLFPWITLVLAQHLHSKSYVWKSQSYRLSLFLTSLSKIPLSNILYLYINESSCSRHLETKSCKLSRVLTLSSYGRFSPGLTLSFSFSFPTLLERNISQSPWGLDPLSDYLSNYLKAASYIPSPFQSTLRASPPGSETFASYS